MRTRWLLGVALACSLTVLGAAPAGAATTLTVTADDFDQDVTVGSTTTVTVTVMAGESPTAGPVRIRVHARGGQVVGADGLGFPLSCRARPGAAACRTDGAIGAFDVVELAVAVRVGPAAGRRGALVVTAVASSPRDRATGAAVEVVPVAPAT